MLKACAQTRAPTLAASPRQPAAHGCASTAPVNYTNLAYVARETWTFTSWTQ